MTKRVSKVGCLLLLLASSWAIADCGPAPSTAHRIEIVECYSELTPAVASKGQADAKTRAQINRIVKGNFYKVIGGRRINEADVSAIGQLGEWRAPSSEGLLYLYIQTGRGKYRECPYFLGHTTEIRQTPKCCDTMPNEECLARMDYGKKIRDEKGCWKGALGKDCRRKESQQPSGGL